MVVGEKVERRTLESFQFSPFVETVLRRIGYTPTGEEQAAIIRGMERFCAVVGGDQSGKSMTAGAKFMLRLYDDLVEHVGAGEGETLIYWLVASDYSGVRAEFDYIVENLGACGFPVEATKRIDPGEIVVKMPGQKKELFVVRTKSAKDPRMLRMESPNGIVICEAAVVDLETFHRCMLRAGGARGWVLMSGSYDGSLGWYPGVIKAWGYGDAEHRGYRLPTPSNWHLYPGGEHDPEIERMKRESPDEYFLERIMGIASPPKGLVFPEVRPDVHVRGLEYDPTLPVYIWDDPGYGHAHAIEVAQIMGREGARPQVRIFDEIYKRGVITADMIDICKERLWWKNPAVKLVIDPHYKDQHPGQKSIADIWRAAGLICADNRRMRVTEGTERMKFALKMDNFGEPGLVIDPKCVGILSELGVCPNPFDGQTRVYQWKMDREGNVLGEEPEDRYNDGVKAVIYGLVEEFGLATGGRKTQFIMKRH